MNYETIRIERNDDVVIVRLNQPASLNAVTAGMCDELLDALGTVGNTARAMVLTGEGRAFCSGAKLEGERDEDLGRFLETHVNPVITALRDLPIPWISAVRGAAAGVGCSLALVADMIVASRTAYFLQVFVNIGLVPDGGAFHLLVRTIGRVRAVELMMLGERLSAERALVLGLINRVVDDEALATAALELAQKLARGPTLALAAIRKMAWNALDEDWSAGLRSERAMQGTIGRSVDAHEGIAAFLEKRPAVFTGGPATMHDILLE